MIEVTKQAKTLDEGIKNLIDASKLDYENFGYANTHRKLDFEVKEGKKYIKIIRDDGVHCFIVKENDNKFNKGDILKPASWSTPAKNQARGNILSGFNIAWTGPMYLK